jgi:hypothetical protein
MAALTLVLYTALFLWAFWYVYIVVMGLFRAHLQGRLKGFVFVLALPAIIVGYLMDVLANLTVASVVFLEPPREWLVTDRLSRYIAGYPGWRQKLAAWICDHLLDVFDPSGDHC